MRELMTGISTWIIPTIAATAKLMHEQAHKTSETDPPQFRSDDRDNARRGDRACNEPAHQAESGAMKWPD